MFLKIIPFVASWSSLDLLPNNESISSINITHGFNFLAKVNIAFTNLLVSPYHLFWIESRPILIKLISNSLAIANLKKKN